MTEPTHSGDLARHARRTLAEASAATLLIHGSVDVCEPVAFLQEDDGVPSFWCEPGSVIVAAAHEEKPALLTVAARDGRGTMLVLAGRLHVLEPATVDGRRVDVVGMMLMRVMVERHRGSGAPSRRVIPLDAYSDAEPDHLGDFAARLVEHINADHHTELRHFIAAHFGLPRAVVAGARLAELDRNGAVLRWIDAIGAHSFTIEFTKPMRTCSDLARSLRDHLTAGIRY